MKKCLVSLVVLGSAVLLPQVALAEDVSDSVGSNEVIIPSVEHPNKLVTELHSPDTRACAFFRLDGVSEADPVKPGNPWFAVPTNHRGYDVIVDNLRVAIVHDKRVYVSTTGTLECGHAALLKVRLFR